MDLQYFINLSWEVIDKIKQSTFSWNINHCRFPAIFLFIQLKSNNRVVENFAARSIIQCNKLARHKVIFDFEEPYVLSPTSNKAIIYNWVEFQTYKVEIAQLTTK
jgi:hypothetical protein